MVGSALAQTLTRDRLISMMVGRDLTELYPTPMRRLGDTVLSVRGLDVAASPGKQPLQDISFTVRAGEIVGLAGLLGAGRTELLEATNGVSSAALVSGAVELSGQPCRFRPPRDAIRAGLGYVAEDCKGQSLVLPRSVAENVSLAALGQFTRVAFLNLSAEARSVGAVALRLRIKTPSLETPVGSLSGGNQQKVVLARCLMNTPRLFLLDEPTQGIDVGARAEIYALIGQIAQGGTAVLLAPSDMPELLALCDRILVMCEGRVAGELARHEASQERVLYLATRFHSAALPPDQTDDRTPDRRIM